MYTVYLAGEIHSNWREEIITGCKDCDVTFLTPEHDHASSDDIGKNVVGEQGSDFYNDNVSAKINSMRSHTYIKRADIVVVKFGEKYKQWNAAFDAGFAIALSKKLIVIHPEEFIHALKEIDAAASAVVKSQSQVIDILKHLTRK
ncbi:MAG: YtoQ family protein [Sulfurimonas sp.]|nr:YtoQ family protein [Sulfurimonas sp.]